MSVAVLWVTTACSAGGYQRFEGTYRLLPSELIQGLEWRLTGPKSRSGRGDEEHNFCSRWE